jgi:hypothetical protein
MGVVTIESSITKVSNLFIIKHAQFAFLAMRREYYKTFGGKNKIKFIESVSGHITHDLSINF